MDSRAVTNHAELVPAPAVVVRVVTPAAARDRTEMRMRARHYSPRSSLTRRNTRESRRHGRMFSSRRDTSRARNPGPEMRALALRHRPRKVNRRHIPPQVEVDKYIVILISQKA